jgi:hypothetical protein
MAPRPLRFGFMDLVEGLADLLPAFLRRPFGRVVLLCYDLETAMPFLLACVVAGLLAPTLFDALPRDESIPSLVGLAALLAIIWRQWWRIERLEREIRDIQKEEDEEYLTGDDMCSD